MVVELLPGGGIVDIFPRNVIGILLITLKMEFCSYIRVVGFSSGQLSLALATTHVYVRVNVVRTLTRLSHAAPFEHSRISEGLRIDHSENALFGFGELLILEKPSAENGCHAPLCERIVLHGIVYACYLRVFQLEIKTHQVKVATGKFPTNVLVTVSALASVNTNDAFVGVDSLPLSYTSSAKIYPPAFDAGEISSETFFPSVHVECTTFSEHILY